MNECKLLLAVKIKSLSQIMKEKGVAKPAKKEPTKPNTKRKSYDTSSGNSLPENRALVCRPPCACVGCVFLRVCISADSLRCCICHRATLVAHLHMQGARTLPNRSGGATLGQTKHKLLQRKQ